jgi:hypothetical protein
MAILPHRSTADRLKPRVSARKGPAETHFREASALFPASRASAGAYTVIPALDFAARSGDIRRGARPMAA